MEKRSSMRIWRPLFHKNVLQKCPIHIDCGIYRHLIEYKLEGCFLSRREVLHHEGSKRYKGEKGKKGERGKTGKKGS